MTPDHDQETTDHLPDNYELHFALISAKKRIEYDHATDVVDIDPALPEPVLREQVRRAIMHEMDDDEVEAMDAEKDARFGEIFEEFEDIEDADAIVERFDTDDVDDGTAE